MNKTSYGHIRIKRYIGIMQKNRRQVKTFRKDNICNICQKSVKKLTWDHIPPKGWSLGQPIKVYNYPEGSANDEFIPSHSPNGVKFSTICQECNNLLGSRYDCELSKFVNNIRTFVLSRLYIPKRFTIRTKPTAIIKAILGHFLAAKTDYCNNKTDQAIRSYLFNEKAILDSDLKVYYWFYPYEPIIINTDNFTFDLFNDTRDTIFFSIIKCSPVAFMLTNCSSIKIPGFIELTQYNNNDISEEKDIPFELSNIPHNYPESIDFVHLRFVGNGHTELFAI